MKRSGIRSNRGLSITEVLVSAVVLVGVMGVAGAARLLLDRGSHMRAYQGRPQELGMVLERINRVIRTARVVEYPVPGTIDPNGQPVISECLYLVNAHQQPVLFSFREGVLYQMELAATGNPSPQVLARGLTRVAFSTVPGIRPRVRVALAAADALVIGQVIMLNSDPPLMEGD